MIIKTISNKLFLFAVLVFLSQLGFSQRRSKNNTETKSKVNSSIISGLKFRSIGPAFTSGRIADFAVNSKNPSEYYVAIASGNIWKTSNNGVTFKPVFDNYGSYSIGCLAMDPCNSNVVWAGTGENNHQRALGYGDGIYKTVDGGKSWKNMGLKDSRHIGMIAINPKNTDIVYVAAEGSAWGPGGDRGLYKTTDGGKNWEKILFVSDNTGFNNVLLDPRNPDIIYATSEQRRRHVHTKIGGGPESAIYKSTDGGKNWRKIEKGIPSVHKGGMGIAISPVNPDVLYVIIEAAMDKGGFFRSTDRGESWKKMSSHSSSGQYYNEIYCDPIDVNRVYSVETFTHVTTDGGKTWNRLSNSGRHVDDHALWINPNNNKHFIIGGDGGVYITYDQGKAFLFVSNLPVTQFYRVYLDNDYPFYNVYGGTQDNNSFGGPSQNKSRGGVTSGEWTVTLGGDGFWGAVDPKDPNIVYSEYQYGNIYRYDKKSGESLYIKPQPGENEKTYRWNWNAPFIMSPHSNKRLYIAANKLFRSDNRGQSWETISDDLTAQIDRNTWKVMDKFWSSEAVVKDVSTSLYNTIVSLDESPVKENLLYVGTDDGVIQIAEDENYNWRKISSFPGVPTHTYVSDIFADRFDENTVYASFDNRKRDDFKPYLLKSTDKGKSWTSITNGLPDNGTVHTIQQDFINKDLLFVGTEFGAFFSYNGGKNWIQLKSGIPTIAVRDMAIQQRETDLVLATFGRGFYILDNYAPLREINETLVDKDFHLFPIKDALRYYQTRGRYGQGATFFTADNPEFGATFTYYIKDVKKSDRAKRRKKEKELFKNGQKIPQLSLKELSDEEKQEKSYLLFTIKDKDGNIIRKLTKAPSKGINQINWDLRQQNPSKVRAGKKFNPYKKTQGGYMVAPGKYTVHIAIYEFGKYRDLGISGEFNVVPIKNDLSLPGNLNEIENFQKQIAEIAKKADATVEYTEELKEKVIHAKQTLLSTPDADEQLMAEVQKVEKQVEEILFAFNGVQPRASYEEVPPHDYPIYRRIRYVLYTHYSSSSAITQTEKDQFEIVKKQLPEQIQKLKEASDAFDAIEKKLDELGAPWTKGRFPKLD